MKTVFITIFIIAASYCNLFSQLQGAENETNKTIYKGTFKVNGNKDTYYPVIFKYGEQNYVNNLKIWRSYNSPGPNELSPTHKGGLTLEIDVNYGGWGGSTYDWRIMDLRQTYHTTFAGAAHCMHRMGFVIWLRGGGFVYFFESSKPSNIHVAYSTSEIIYPNANPSYQVYAPAPKTTPDAINIGAHMNGFFTRTAGNNISYNSGSVGIGISNPGAYKLAVNGSIRTKEVVVTADNWPDYVFQPEYTLRPLAEVEAHIATHGHLPEVPNAQQVEENGIGLGEMNALLLKKVEELTLYSIEQQKEIEELKKQNKRIEELERQNEVVQLQGEEIEELKKQKKELEIQANRIDELQRLIDKVLNQ